MAKKKKSISKNKAASAGRRRAKNLPRIGHTGPNRFSQYFLPGVLSVVIIGCLFALVSLGYRTVTASDFFNVKKIDVSGTSRSSDEDIRRIIASQSERTGVLNADLADMRQKIEKLPFVKFAAVSRVLPNGIRVVITERVPIAVVKIGSGTFLIDADGEILAPPKNDDTELMTITGWDNAKTERAGKDNTARIRMFQKMIADWGEFGLAKRVKEVDLSDLQEPRAITEDSGSRIPITLAKDNFTKSLKSALEAIAGKGEKVKSVNSGGVYPVIEYIGTN